MPRTVSNNPMTRFLPPIADPPALNNTPPVRPSETDIKAWWDRFEVMDHIREHSSQVARVAHHIALVGAERGLKVDPERVLAAGLLHDIAKAYTVLYGGNHCQTGAAWALELTGDLVIAQCVHHHVYWPFSLDIQRYFEPLAVLYADKRVAHTTLVPLNTRYQDLIERYGTTEIICKSIRETERQACCIEDLFSELLGENLNESAFDRGRLVE